MEVTYTKPEPGGMLAYDLDQRSEKKSLGGKSTMTTMSQAANRLLRGIFMIKSNSKIPIIYFLHFPKLSEY